MSGEVKRSFGKIRTGLAALGLAILVSLMVSSGSAAHGRAKQLDRQTLPLGELLRPPGTSGLPEGIWGSQDRLGLELTSGLDEAPHFDPMKTTSEGVWGRLLQSARYQRIGLGSGGGRLWEPLCWWRLHHCRGCCCQKHCHVGRIPLVGPGKWDGRG